MGRVRKTIFGTTAHATAYPSYHRRSARKSVRGGGGRICATDEATWKDFGKFHTARI